ncbi:MAG: hypothetical protein JNL01_06605 [Bdellovibrionales bacterium]|nr:hypothetical protein [Bdellovibrionales bacterium]
MKGKFKIVWIVALSLVAPRAWSQTMYGPLNTIPAPAPKQPGQAGDPNGTGGSMGGEGEVAGGEGGEGKKGTVAGNLLRATASNIAEGAKEVATEAVKQKVGKMLGVNTGDEDEDLDTEEVKTTDLENPNEVKVANTGTGTGVTPGPSPTSALDKIVQKNNAELSAKLKESMDPKNLKFDREKGTFVRRTKLDQKKEEIEAAGGKWKENGAGWGVADFDGEETKKLGSGTTKVSQKEVYDQNGNKVGKQTTTKKYSNGFLGLGQKKENARAMNRTSENFTYGDDGTTVVGRTEKIENVNYRRDGSQRRATTQYFNYGSQGQGMGSTVIQSHTNNQGVTRFKSQAYDPQGNKLQGRAVSSFSTKVNTNYKDSAGNAQTLENDVSINARNNRDFKRQLAKKIQESKGTDKELSVSNAKLKKQLDRIAAKDAARKAAKDRADERRRLKDARSKMDREQRIAQAKKDREAIATKRRVDREKKQLIAEGKDPNTASKEGKRSTVGNALNKINPFKKKTGATDETVSADGTPKKKGFLGGIFKKKDRSPASTTTTKEKKGFLGGIFKKKNTGTSSTSTTKKGGGFLGGLFGKKNK